MERIPLMLRETWRLGVSDASTTVGVCLLCKVTCQESHSFPLFCSMPSPTALLNVLMAYVIIL